MTPEQRALKFLKELELRMAKMGVMTTAHYDAGSALLSAAIRDAVAEEREACAALADAVGTVRWPRQIDSIGPDIARAIRARGKV